MPARIKLVNLLPRSDYGATWWGRFLGWALSAGRYIIILTELVVILAFLSRFKLDKDHSELAERIAGKKNVLEALAASEREFIRTRSRLEATGEMMKLQPAFSEVVGEVETTVPGGVKFSSLSILGKTMVVTGTANSEADLGIFLRENSQKNRWKTVELENVAANRETGIKFAMRVRF